MHRNERIDRGACLDSNRSPYFVRCSRAAGADPRGSGDPVPTPAGKAACGKQRAGISPQHLRLAAVRGGAAGPERRLLYPGRDAALHRAAAIATWELP
ncbi:hypothetical protein DV515_00003623 [Chloebia gouldiae]|uniref:Uncharacterized protein n=1 Tax=Chloebia gouldiae TaxID=44316 RepID=A0A3L8SSN9_CHLGU|nr:hypothetical protein DV515_00003623 [Chloebia gouldiae]